MKQLKDLNKEELKALYNNNHDFAETVDNSIYEMNMQAQYDDSIAIFGEHNDTYALHDHYNSFYLTVEDAEKFAESIEDPDYLNAENRKLYEETREMAEKWNNMDYDEQDENGELYEQIAKKSQDLADGITEQLRAYERIDDAQVDEELDAILSGELNSSEWKTDGTKVYQEITKVYE